MLLLRLFPPFVLLGFGWGGLTVLENQFTQQLKNVVIIVVEEKWLHTYPMLETMCELIFQPQLLGQKEKAED